MDKSSSFSLSVPQNYKNFYHKRPETISRYYVSINNVYNCKISKWHLDSLFYYWHQLQMGRKEQHLRYVFRSLKHFISEFGSKFLRINISNATCMCMYRWNNGSWTKTILFLSWNVYINNIISMYFAFLKLNSNDWTFLVVL